MRECPTCKAPLDDAHPTCARCTPMGSGRDLASTMLGMDDALEALLREDAAKSAPRHSQPLPVRPPEDVVEHTAARLSPEARPQAPDFEERTDTLLSPGLASPGRADFEERAAAMVSPFAGAPEQAPTAPLPILSAPSLATASALTETFAPVIVPPSAPAWNEDATAIGFSPGALMGASDSGEFEGVTVVRDSRLLQQGGAAAEAPVNATSPVAPAPSAGVAVDWEALAVPRAAPEGARGAFSEAPTDWETLTDQANVADPRRGAAPPIVAASADLSGASLDWESRTDQANVADLRQGGMAPSVPTLASAPPPPAPPDLASPWESQTDQADSGALRQGAAPVPTEQANAPAHAPVPAAVALMETAVHEPLPVVPARGGSGDGGGMEFSWPQDLSSPAPSIGATSAPKSARQAADDLDALFQVDLVSFEQISEAIDDDAPLRAVLPGFAATAARQPVSRLPLEVAAAAQVASLAHMSTEAFEPVRLPTPVSVPAVTPGAPGASVVALVATEAFQRMEPVAAPLPVAFAPTMASPAVDVASLAPAAPPVAAPVVPAPQAAPAPVPVPGAPAPLPVPAPAPDVAPVHAKDRKSVV